MSWFIDWFNSPYYHLLYKHRDQLEASAFIDNLLINLQPKESHRFLDLACGNGRHANYIASKNYHIIGVDLSPENILTAQSHQVNDASFFVHDMRNYFRSNYFDFVLNLFTSFAYFDSEHDEIRAMQMAANALKKKGTLIIDFFNAERLSHCIVPIEEKAIGEVKFTIRKKIENGYILKNININDQGKELIFQEKVRLLNQQAFENLFEKSGLQLIETFGDYQMQSYHPMHSDRLILKAVKI
jgi:SAM-dependent methyltransferase